MNYYRWYYKTFKLDENNVVVVDQRKPYFWPYADNLSCTKAKEQFDLLSRDQKFAQSTDVEPPADPDQSRRGRPCGPLDYCDASNLINVALNKDPTVTSQEPGSGWLANHASDGNRDSTFSTGLIDANSVFIMTFDFKAICEPLRTVKIQARIDDSRAFPWYFHIQVSADNMNWQTVLTRYDEPVPPLGGTVCYPIEFVTGQFRYARLVTTKNRNIPGDGIRVQVGEIEFFASSATPVETSGDEAVAARTNRADYTPTTAPNTGNPTTGAEIPSKTQIVTGNPDLLNIGVQWSPEGLGRIFFKAPFPEDNGRPLHIGIGGSNIGSNFSQAFTYRPGERVTIFAHRGTGPQTFNETVGKKASSVIIFGNPNT